jgi:molybdate transport system substrate-binding protein
MQGTLLVTTRRSLLATALLAAPGLAAAQPAPVRILSAGAVEPGLRAALAGQATPTELTFATAPALRTRLTGAERPDVLIAPQAVMQEVAAQLGTPRVTIGRVGVGIAVNLLGAALPVPDEATLRQRLMDADMIVINRGSTGQYMDSLFARMGIADAIAGKILRYDDGAEVLARIGRSTAIRGLGFAPVTEIRLAMRDQPVQLLAPLPAAVQNFTTYDAAPLRESPRADAARALVTFLGTAPARAAMTAEGVEAAR